MHAQVCNLGEEEEMQRVSTRQCARPRGGLERAACSETQQLQVTDWGYGLPSFTLASRRKMALHVAPSPASGARNAARWLSRDMHFWRGGADAARRPEPVPQIPVHGIEDTAARLPRFRERREATSPGRRDGEKQL